jgi:hypothetical protein
MLFLTILHTLHFSIAHLYHSTLTCHLSPILYSFGLFLLPPWIGLTRLEEIDAARTSPVSASSRTVGHPTLLQATFARRSWIDTHLGRVRADLATLRRRVSISLRFAYRRNLELLPSQQASQTQLPRTLLVARRLLTDIPSVQHICTEICRPALTLTQPLASKSSSVRATHTPFNAPEKTYVLTDQTVDAIRKMCDKKLCKFPQRNVSKVRPVPQYRNQPQTQPLCPKCKHRISVHGHAALSRKTFGM